MIEKKIYTVAERREKERYTEGGEEREREIYCRRRGDRKVEGEIYCRRRGERK